MKKKVTCIAYLKTGAIVKDTVKIDTNDPHQVKVTHDISEFALNELGKDRPATITWGSTAINLQDCSAIKFTEGK